MDPQIIHFNGSFNHKPSINHPAIGVSPRLWKSPCFAHVFPHFRLVNSHGQALEDRPDSRWAESPSDARPVKKPYKPPKKLGILHGFTGDII